MLEVYDRVRVHFTKHARKIYYCTSLAGGRVSYKYSAAVEIDVAEVLSLNFFFTVFLKYTYKAAFKLIYILIVYI